MGHRKIASCLTCGITALLLCAAVHAQNSTRTPAPVAVPAAATQLHVITAQSSMADIRALPDNAMVRTRGGRVVPARTLKLLASAIKMAQERRAGGPGRPPPPQLLSRTPLQAPVQVQVRPGMSLRGLAARPDADVLQLPTGQKLTVGDFKKLSEFERRRTGTSLIDRQSRAAPIPSGPAIKVNSHAELAALAARPDSTVVENRAGRRITLGQLRAHARRTGRGMGA
jgi:hypothetical protein